MGRIKDWLITGLCVFYTLYHIAYSLRLFETEKLYIYAGAHHAFSLGLILLLVFLLVPRTKGASKSRLPWYDLLLGLGSLVGCLYVAINFETIIGYRMKLFFWELVLGIFTITAVLEATRRTIGLIMAIVAVIFILYAKFGNLIPGLFHCKGYNFSWIVSNMYLWPEGLFGPIMHIVSTIIVVFMIFAAFLQASGAARFFLDISLSIVGHLRGGPAKVAIIASSLFGTMCGSAVANTAATGQITIPLMIKAGYRPQMSGAIEAVASTGGQLMPPVMGAAAFVMAEFLEMSYWSICIAAFVPALLYYLAAFIIAHAEAAKMALEGLPRQSLPSFKKTLIRGWVYLVPIVVLVYFLGIARYGADVSCMYALGTLVVLTMLRKETRWTPRKLIGALEAGAHSMLPLGAVAGSAGIVLGIVSMTGLGLNLSSAMVKIAGGNILTLLVLGAFASIILGMGLPSTPCYILLAILVAPALIQLGILPIAAHLFAFYFGMAAMITPPICVAAFVGASIARAPMMRTGFEAARLGLVLYLVPFIFVYNPALLMHGSPLTVVKTVIIATLGIYILSSGVGGYLLQKLNLLERVIVLAGGVMLIVPNYTINIVGVSCAVLVFALQVLQKRRSLW